MSKSKNETAVPTKTRAEYQSEIQLLRESMPAPITAPQVFVTDTTPEGCRQFLSENGERCTVLTDEAGIFEIMSGMYSDGKANLDVFLQGHPGGPLRVQRGKEKWLLSKIALSMGLAIQPEPLQELGSGDKKRFRGKGLLARFLFCLPKSNIGTRDVRNRIPIPDDVREAYQQGIKRLLNIKPEMNAHGSEQPRILALDLEALSSWQRFSQWVENQQGDGGKFERIQDFTGKLPGAALRIAALCHVAEHGESNRLINEAMLEPVIDLCEKLITHAQAAFGMMGDDPVIADAKEALRWIVCSAKKNDRGAWFIKQNELLKSSRFKNTRLKRLTDALEALRDRNILSPQQKISTEGRPSLIWYVNPTVLVSDGSNELA